MRAPMPDIPMIERSQRDAINGHLINIKYNIGVRLREIDQFRTTQKKLEERLQALDDSAAAASAKGLTELIRLCNTPCCKYKITINK